MNNIVISGYGIRIRYRNGLLLIESKQGEREIPLVNIDQVIIATSGVWLSSKVVRKLIEHGVDLVFLGSRGLPVGRVYPPFVNKIVETRRAQYSSQGSSRGVLVIKEIAYSKIANQAGLIRKYYYYTRIEDLREIYTGIMDIAHRARELNGSYEEIRDKIRLLESEAARLYWPGYALLTPRELGFTSRDQDSDDPVNICLNYGYGVLYTESWRVLTLAGLDPYAGFIHVDRGGKPVLVFDFIEMFRFIVDDVVLKLLRRNWRPVVLSGLLDYDSRNRIINEIYRYLDETRSRYIDESPLTLRQVLKKTAFQLACFLRGECFFEGFVHGW